MPTRYFGIVLAVLPPCLISMAANAADTVPVNQPSAAAQDAAENDLASMAPRPRREIDPGAGFSYLGVVQPRHARSIEASNWSVGAETMGRDYTIYANWKSYLGPLGAKKARIQSGWAKTEKERGQYQWDWLDEIILDMVNQGVEPWVCLCYGNPIYPGGGGTGLGGGLPQSQEALQAWDRFVAAFIQRYREHVDEWEIWNEPGLREVNGTEKYATFFIRTARVVRQHQPGATIIGLSLPGIPLDFTRAFLQELKQRTALNLLDVVSYHPYAYNPDDRDEAVQKLRALVRSFSPRITILQGENGAPSRRGNFGALSNYDWNERRQAKWALRRLIGDLGHDIPSSYFAICDMIYRVGKKGRDSDWRDAAGDIQTRPNNKGLLAVNPDKTVAHPKVAYRAVQHVTAIFDNSVQRVRKDTCTLAGTDAPANYRADHYRTRGGVDIVTLWRTSDPPGKRTETQRLQLTVRQGRFHDPVLVDLLSGDVWRIDKQLLQAHDNAITFTRVPAYDSVILIADRDAIPLRKR